MNPGEEKRNDEIDLLELFRRIGKAMARLFSELFRAVISSVVFLFRKWLPLSISVFIALGIAYGIKKIAKPEYRSEIVFRTNTGSNSDMIRYINRLHEFTKGKNTAELSGSLGITTEQAAAIKDIEAFWIIDRNNDGTADYFDFRNKHNVYDTVNIRISDRFVVRTSVNSIEGFNAVRSGILSYIEKNSLLSEQNSLRLKQTDELLLRLDYDINQLDSLQKVKYFEETRGKLPDKNGQMVFLQEQKTQLVYEDIYKLYERKQNLELQKNIYGGIVTVITEFTIPVKQLNGTVYYSLFTVPAFVFLTLLYLVISENRKRIKEWSARF